MIPHHEMALEMTDADVVLQKGSSVEVKAMAQAMKDACQAGNYGLALKTIVDWLERLPLDTPTTVSGRSTPSDVPGG